MNAIEIEDLWKKYRLGVIGYGTLRQDVQSYLAKLFGKADPNKQVEDIDDGTRESEFRFWALQNINLNIKQGEVLGIIGKNGAGKSTLIKIISRITSPTRGTIRIRGKVSTLLEVGTGFHPELTGRENVYINAAVHGMPRSEVDKRLDSIVHFSGIERFIDTPVKRYSSGMYVRLAFAVAAHLDPDILIVDEVLAVGDYEFQKRCLSKMGEVGAEGRTVMFVSHNMQSISNLAKSGILLDEGQISFSGNALEAVERYLTDRSGDKPALSWKSPEEAPGGNSVRLKSIEVVGEDGMAKQIFDIQEPIFIKYEVWNLKEGGNVYIGSNVKDDMDMYAFIATNMPSEILNENKTVFENMPKGLVKATLKIPANFLNTHTYSLDVGIGANFGKTTEIVLPEALSFSVKDMSGRNKYGMNWYGPVRPKFEWECEV